MLRISPRAAVSTLGLCSLGLLLSLLLFHSASQEEGSSESPAYRHEGADRSTASLPLPIPPTETPDAADEHIPPQLASEIKSVVSDIRLQKGLTETRDRIFETSLSHTYIRLTEKILHTPDSPTPLSHTWELSVADQAIVRLAPDSDPSQAAALLDGLDLDATPLGTAFDLLAVTLRDSTHLDKFSNTLERLSQNADLFQFAEPDYLLQASTTPNDPLLPRQTNLDSGITPAQNRDIDAFKAWETRSRSPNTIIAIIDSGITIDHEDLRDNLWNNPRESANNHDDDGNGYIDDLHGIAAAAKSGTPRDANGHGTHVAGIAAAKGNNGIGIAGVTWDAQIMALSFLDSKGFGATSDAITCIDYAITQEANIINNSWGGNGRSQALEDTLLRASDQGILIATAAGNNGENLDASPSYPAAFSIPNQVVVIATDSADARSHYSNYSSRKADIAAPGRALSSFKGDGSDYTELEGTSMATPLVAGSLAILKAEFPDESPSRLISRLLESSETRVGLAGACLSEGRLNLDRALRGLSNIPANDDFAHAIPFPSEGGLLNGSLGQASSEEAEPRATRQASGRSVWYRWTPSVDTSSLLTLQPAGFRGAIAIYQDNEHESLTRIASNQSENAGDPVSLAFQPAAGETLYLQIDSASSHGGSFALELLQAPTNDTFAYPTQLDGDSFATIASNRAATTQSGETLIHPAASGSTIWFTWQAAENGAFYLNFLSRDGQLFSRVYTGASLADLTPVATQFEATSQANQVFEVIQGETYRIAVDSLLPTGQSFGISGSYLTAPTIISQPRDQAATLRSLARFSVIVVGQGEATYEWYKDGTAIPESDTPELTIPAVQESDVGSYHCLIRIGGQIVVSSPARLIAVPESLTIYQQPAAQSILEGEPLELSAFLSRAEGLEFQWLKDGIPVPGATTNILKIANTRPDDSGYYTLEFKEGFISQTTRSVYVKVSPSSGYKNVAWITLPTGLHGATEIFHMGGLLAAPVENMLATSQDGVSWQYSPRVANCFAFGQDVFLAAGYEGLTQSDNGYDWSAYVSTPTHFRSLTHGAEAFVGVGNNAVYISKDKGATWTQSFASGSQKPYAVIYAKQKFWLSSDSGIFTSTDGTDWTAVPTAPQNAGNLHYADQRFWHLAQGQVSVSSDGQDWTTLDVDGGRVEQLVTSPDTDQVYAEVSQSEGSDIILGQVQYLYRIDGDTSQKMTRLGSYTDAQPGLFLFGGELHISSQYGQTRPEAYRPKTWTGENTIWSQRPLITYSEEIYISTNTIANRSVVHSSTDGTNWKLEAQLFDSTPIGRILSGNGQYLSTRYAGSSLGSLKPHNMDLRDIAFGNNTFVATAATGLLYSQNGKDWSISNSSVSNLSNVLFANGRFLAYSSDSIHTSENGKDWSTGNVNAPRSITAIGYGNGHYILFAGSSCYTSNDGLSWTRKGTVSEPGVSSNVSQIAYFNGKFVALYHESFLFESTDGSNWKRMDLDINTSDLISTGTQLLFSTSRGIAVLGTANPQTNRLTARAFTGTAKVPLGSAIEIEFDAYSSAGPLDSLIAYVNGQQWQTLAPGTTSFQFIPPSIGEYDIEIVSQDASGNEARAEVSLAAVQGFTTYSLSPSQQIYDLIYARGAYYAACPGGRLLVSTDGENWRTLQTPTTEDLLSIVENDAGFVIDHKGKGVLTSTDGVEWIQVGDFVSFYPTRSDSFFAIGSQPTPLRSLDGKTWVPIESSEEMPTEHATRPDFTEILNIPYNGSYIVRYNQAPERVTHNLSYLSNVEQIGSLFIALNGSTVWTSENGATWNATGIEGVDRLYREGPMVFAQNSNQDTRFTLDGENWDSYTYSISGNVRYLDGLYYAVKNDYIIDSYKSRIVVSPNAKHWDPLSESSLDEFLPEYGLVCTPTGIIAFSSDRAILYSNSEYSYIEKFDSRQVIGNDSIDFIGEDVVLAVGNRRAYLRDANGRWSLAPRDLSIRKTAFANGVFLATTHSDGEKISSNGLDWNSTQSPFLPQDGDLPSTRHIYSASDKRFWAASFNNRIAHSADGISWHEVTGLTQSIDIRTLQEFKGQTYAIDSAANKTLYKSADNGSTWQVALTADNLDYRLSATENLLGILKHHSNGPSAILVSADGTNWSEHSLPELNDATLRATKDHFYLAGDQVYRSTDGQNWETVLPFKAEVGTTRSEAFLYTSDNALISLEQNDVSLDHISVTAGEYGIGDTVNVEVTLTNNSPAQVTIDSNQTLSYTLSLNEKRWAVTDQEPGMSGTVTLPAIELAAGESKKIPLALSIPKGLPPGQYFTALYPTQELCLHDSNTANDFAYSPASSMIVVPSRSLSLDVGENGNVNGLGRTQGVFAWKEEILLSATPDVGYNFSGWTGDLDYGEEVLLVQMDDDLDLKAEFSVRTFSIDLSIIGNGTVDGFPSDKKVAYGESLDLTANPAEGWIFEGWNGAGRSESSSFSFGVGRDMSLQAVFTHPYTNWAKQEFGTDDPASTAPNMDTLSYGLQNKAIYALGLLSPDQNQITIQRIRNENGFWKIIYTRYKGAAGFKLTPSWSDDLTQWRTDLVNTTPIAETNDLTVFEASIPDFELERIMFKIEVSDETN